MLRCAVWSAGRALNVQHVFLVGGLLTAGALVPAIAAGGGVPASTCALTGGVLAAYAGAFLHMGQRTSAAIMALNAATWGVLLVLAVAA